MTPSRPAGPGRVDLGRFDARGFDRGAGRIKEALWRAVSWAVFEPSWLHATRLKRTLLRCFGGRVGHGVVIKPSVRISFPWRLTIGHNAWVGEGVWILSLAPVRIGANACVSQRAFLCTGNHDATSRTFDLLVAPIALHAESWVGADAFVAPGVRLRRGAVAGAGSVVTRDLPAWTMCAGNPCTPKASREIRDA